MAYDDSLARQLAKISLWVYGFDDDTLIDQDGAKPATATVRDDRDPATAFAGIVHYPDKTVLVYQGTITNRSTAAIVDWVQNFRIEYLPSDRTGLPGKVHEGFFDQLDAIFSKVTAELARAPGRPLYVTGHSQGGAVAALATKRLELAGIPVAATYTFAAPRPGDADFVASIQAPLHRFEFGNDIVPHAPPLLPDFGAMATGFLKMASAASDLVAQWLRQADAAARMGYRSAGTLTYRTADGALQAELSAEQEAVLLRERVLNLLQAGKTLAEHHHLSNYIGMFDN